MDMKERLQELAEAAGKRISESEGREIRIIKVPSTVATNAMPSRSVNTN